MRFPDGCVLRDVSFFPTRGADRISPVFRKSTHRKQVAAARDHFGSHIAHEVGCINRYFRRELNTAARIRGNSNLVQMGESRINGREVLSHHRLASFPVALADELLDLGYRFIAW